MSTSQVRRMAMKEFRRAARSDTAVGGPIIVTADGTDAFAVVSFDLLKGFMSRPVELYCPHCKGKVRPERVQGRCPSCQDYLNVPNNGTAAG